MQVILFQKLNGNQEFIATYQDTKLKSIHFETDIDWIVWKSKVTETRMIG